MTESSNGAESGGQVTDLTLALVPVPASRPRVTRWGTYYGKIYKNYMAEADKAIPQAKHKHEGNLTVDITFSCTKPKTTKRDCPRGDIDNYIKGILDAITKKGYWNDDDQIVHLRAKKLFAGAGRDPFTRITIAEL